MKKGGFLRNVLDTIRSNQANQSAGGAGSSSSNNASSREFGGQLKPQHFSLEQVARHGFPESPTALAFDPVQKIAAIGTKTGALRVFGRPGVDVWAQHKPEYAVTHIKFVVNQGAIITVTADESIHLWSLRGPNLRLQHSQNSSPSTSSSPAQASHSPAPQQQQQTGATSSLGSTASTQAAAAATTKHADSGAQPGDPDYLADQLSSSSPTYDKSKQYPRQPEILHTLKFQREHITCLHQTLMSKWLYIGTERGNVHVANVETFELSGYSIAWNKAIELCRKTHPGSIIHISECPQDTNKLLIGYESGCIVLWDLKGRIAEGRYYHAENLLWLSWHYEGKQFVAAHGDGSLVTWQTRSNARPANILHPHAKTPTQSGGSSDHQPGDLLNFQQQSSSFVARALNNELYRPINKVDWKTSRNNEQFLLFSGGLPYDGLDGFPSTATSSMVAQQQQQQQQQSSRAASVQPPSSSQSSAQQYLKASSVSHNPSPISPSISPAMNPLVSGNNDPSAAAVGVNKTRQSQQQQAANLTKERKSLRSTSLTVMYGKSITVLEMDDTIIDFITVCENSPYENDTSDPQAVIILLSNDLILIDLTSSGYPSFDSPYPSTNINESPVTCVQYLADCSSDLIPFLYSTSQNVVSRVPKKGFSDKEWPINGGEWGQQMQSYPELVITGHADGTIKFWDMSGVNFDLISKIKTYKFFERPNKLRNSTIMAHSQALVAMSRNSSSNATARVSPRPTTTNAAAAAAMAAGTPATIDQSMATLSVSEQEGADLVGGSPLDESPFAIEKIEYYPSSKHLVVAGALSQVIQFRINKKEPQAGYPVSSSSAGNSSSTQEIATILVDPTHSDSINQPAQQQQPQYQKHLVLKVKNPLASGATGSSSGGSSSSSSGSNRARSSGLQAELICLTPSFLVPISGGGGEFSGADQVSAAAGSSSASAPVARQSSYHCVAPPKVTALALQATHNILAYAHENGIVLVDIIQKCVIISASLSDLYGGASMMQSNRDISIQPFATSSILQHHYQSTVGSPSDFAAGSGFASNNSVGGSAANSDNGPACAAGVSRGAGETEPIAAAKTAKTDNDNGITHNNGAFQKSAPGSSNESGANQKQLPKSRFTANSAFQRQLSTTALHSEQTTGLATTTGRVGTGTKGSSAGQQQQPPRLFQRQMTASQLFNHSSQPSAAQTTEALTNKQRAAALLASARANNPELASSTSCLSGAATTPATTSPLSFMSPGGSGRPSTAATSESSSSSSGAKKVGKKRIISRMLSISAIHTTPSLTSLDSPTTGGPTGANYSSATGFGGGSGGAHNGTPTGPTMTSDGDQVPDKIDSSFTRSRSSSTSSSAATAAAAAAQTMAAELQSALGESVQCLCFLDWSQAMAANSGLTLMAAPSSSSAPATNVGPATAPTANNNGGAAGSPPSMLASGANNKSLGCSPIAASTAADYPTGQLALWLGTSHGSVLLVHLQMPDNEDNRVLQLQSVNAEPIPQASIKLPGAILCLAPFTSELQSVAPSAAATSAGGQVPPNLSGSSSSGPQSTSSMSMDLGDSGVGSMAQGSQSSLANVGSGGANHHPSNCSPQSSFDSRSSLFLAIVSEKEAKIYQIPSQARAAQQHQQSGHKHHHAAAAAAPPLASASAAGAGAGHQQKHGTAGATMLGQQQQSSLLAAQIESSPLGKLLTNKANCISRMDISDSSYACRSQLVQMRQPDETCLVSYLATGNVVVHSLPRLRLLLEADFVPHNNRRIGSSMCFSRNGHCLYQPSGGEISKFTVSAQYRSLVNEMTGLLYVARDMPEMPRANFFKSLFSVASSSAASKQSDRDELFGECSAGKASRNVAKHFSTGASASGLEKLRNAAVGTMGHDLRVAREGLDERGEKLGEIEDRTLQMMNQSESYATAAHQLAQKFKEKKWYQF